MRILLAAALVIFATQAQARSCNDIAASCLNIAIKGGYDRTEWRGKCYEPSRMAACRSTLQYNAPNGKVWPATKP